MRAISRRVFIGLVPPMLAMSLSAAEREEARTYKTGYSSIMKLGKDIHAALKAEYREIIAAQPISIETDTTPFARLLYFSDQPKAIRGVWISAGFIDLVNQVAHAKAIDRREKDYFNRYGEMLAQETGQQPLRPLPDVGNARFWTEEMLNEQQSNFNSIVGMVVGMKLANHYLGHYDRYRGKLNEEKGPAVAINNLLTRAEWEEAFRDGVRNAVRAGCMTEGVIPFFEAFDRMKRRPAWAGHFLPDDVKFSSMRQEMERMQRLFLEGKE
ncbi:MAG: hypothetical protein ACXW32_02015 [Limisphaerales bacterium]